MTYNVKEKLTVIVPTEASEDRIKYLNTCVRTLNYYTPYFRVIIAVNGNKSVGLDPNLNNFEYIKIEQQGQCNAVNVALQRVETPYVMVTNDDMVYGAGWDKPFMKGLEEHRVCSPNLMEPHEGAHPFLTINEFGENIDNFKSQQWFSLSSQFHSTQTEVNSQDGFNLPFATETKILRSIGGYDVAYDPYGSNSDPDIMYRFMLAGLRPTRIRSSIVWHFSLKSSERAKGTEQHNDWFKNWNYFIHKWGFERQAEDRIWYAGGKNGVRIPTKEQPYYFEHAAGNGTHPGFDYCEFNPPYKGKYGSPFYGDGLYYSQ